MEWLGKEGCSSRCKLVPKCWRTFSSTAAILRAKKPEEKERGDSKWTGYLVPMPTFPDSWILFASSPFIFPRDPRDPPASTPSLNSSSPGAPSLYLCKGWAQPPYLEYEDRSEESGSEEPCSRPCSPASCSSLTSLSAPRQPALYPLGVGVGNRNKMSQWLCR